jgi:TPR repeat protein
VAWHLQRREMLDDQQLRSILADHPGKAAQAIIGAAAAHDVEAQALLGQILLDGTGIERDPRLAMVWFEIAARNGHVMARNLLGRCHEHGWGCQADPAKAAAQYQLAAAAGLDWGLYNLGNLLATGRGVDRDQIRALNCYRQAAESGHAKSMNLLGRYLEEGLCCERNLPAAYAWYQRSADGGDFRGQFSHATVLAEHGRIDEALGWLRRALAHGNLNFLRVSRIALLSSANPQIKALALDYHQRAAAIGEESDRVALQRLVAE